MGAEAFTTPFSLSCVNRLYPRYLRYPRFVTYLDFRGAGQIVVVILDYGA